MPPIHWIFRPPTMTHGNKPPRHPGRSLPVAIGSWSDVRTWIGSLNEKESLSPDRPPKSPLVGRGVLLAEQNKAPNESLGLCCFWVRVVRLRRTGGAKKPDVYSTSGFSTSILSSSIGRVPSEADPYRTSAADRKGSRRVLFARPLLAAHIFTTHFLFHMKSAIRNIRSIKKIAYKREALIGLAIRKKNPSKI